VESQVSNEEGLSREQRRKLLHAHNGADQTCVLWLIPLPLCLKHNSSTLSSN